MLNVAVGDSLLACERHDGIDQVSLIRFEGGNSLSAGASYLAHDKVNVLGIDARLVHNLLIIGIQHFFNLLFFWNGRRGKLLSGLGLLDSTLLALCLSYPLALLRPLLGL